MTRVHEGQFGFDAGHEFQVVEISPDGVDVVVEYLSDGVRHRVMKNRLYWQNGELRLA